MTEVRPVRREDLPQLVRLCADHASYEQAPPPAADLADRLGAELFAPRPRVWCFVVEASGRLVGYATGIHEYDPVQEAGFFHLDCLYLDEPHRGQGLGRQLVERIVNQASALGLATVRWQTPAWNTDAIRFYERLGASRTPAIQYTLQ